MLRQRLIEKRSPYGKHNLKSEKESDKPIISEWKLGLCGLISSIVIILAKIYFQNQAYLHQVFIEKRLITYEIITEDGQLMFKNTFESAWKYSNIWLPILCGFLTTYFTWSMVYLDSNVPGIQPPSPLSPSKYRVQSGHSFHLNYVFAIAVGFLVTSYMYWNGVSLHH
ncbi:unnamed protein product [Brassicogethes aeneus]|uniref:ADP-ribosylation factor-like protein 6-interacting protein 6 n=1 Tax=Brassicogethes aeneus TaxID=1431903 RepID=A0A9P0BIL6_BRAAE|nr:unnamed protein product [Brassicogethes aeneus]